MASSWASLTVWYSRRSSAEAVPPTPLSPRELRQLVVNELIHTEQSYFRDLSLIVEVHAFVHARVCVCARVCVAFRAFRAFR